ncbi:MAG: hypothetical protein ACTSXZ_09050 [Alphaproteobacteria bacterium]
MARLWTTEAAGKDLDARLQLHGGQDYMWECLIARSVQPTTIQPKKEVP